MKKFFRLAEHDTTARKEIYAGITTFLTMAYIIFVNPAILENAGMDKGALITVTALAAFFGTMLVGLWANVPLAMAPGMGLNAFFAYSLVLGYQISWETALGVVFVSGLLFFILTIIGIREKIVDSIPVSIRLSISAGIGLFITFIGLKNLGLIVDDSVTLVALGKLTTSVVLGLTGVLIIGILEVKKIKGSILTGIIVTTGLGIIFGEVAMPETLVSLPNSIMPVAFKLDIAAALKWGLAGAVFSFMFVDLFDSIGTIVACSYEAGYVEKDGRINNIDKMLKADAVATLFGSVIGTSTTTSYIESASGIADGGRTGLVSVVTGLLFLLALVFTPVITIVPAFATAPALIIVGVFMFKNIKLIDFTDFGESIPAFIIIVMMPLTFSISNGLSFGFISYVVINSLSGKHQRISLVMWVIAVLALVNLFVVSH